MKKKKSESVLKTKCKDCGKPYTIGAPHDMFCESKTCSFCGSSYGYIIPVYDSRTKPPERKCDRCMENEGNEENDAS